MKKVVFKKNVTKEYIIIEVNGKKVESEVELQMEILKYNVGDSVTLTLVDRNGLSNVNVSVVLHA